MKTIAPLALCLALLLPAAYGETPPAPAPTPARAPAKPPQVVVRLNPEPSHADVAKIRASWAALRAGSLEAKVNYLLDRAEITDLLTAYAYGVDTRDWALHTSVFTDTYQINTGGKFRTETSAQRGKMLTEYFKQFEATQHLVTPQTMTIEGDSAYVTATLHARHFNSDGTPEKNTLLFGHYEFWCVRTADGWRIQKMSMVNRTRFVTAPGLTLPPQPPTTTK